MNKRAIGVIVKNQYIPVWKTFSEVKSMKNLYPEEAKNKILKIFLK